MKAYVLSLRPKTLIAAVVPIVSAAVLAHSEQDNVQYSLFAAALVCALSLQITTNLFNDLIDFKKGADDERRIGPKRVTQSGLMSQKQVLGLALVFSGLALLSGIPLLFVGGWPFLVLGLLSLFLAYGYTGGPFPLAYLGIGDIFVVGFFGLVAVVGSYFLFSGEVSMPSVILGLQLGFLATVLLAINNLRDSNTDILVGKKTLAVRFGDTFVKSEITILIACTFILTLYWYNKYQKMWFGLVLLAVPLALKIIHNVWNIRDKVQLNKMLGLSGLLMLWFSVLMWTAILI
jgi:1,4-dihydroxy-2-naphthoate polyprenyltransferase